MIFILGDECVLKISAAVLPIRFTIFMFPVLICHIKLPHFWESENTVININRLHSTSYKTHYAKKLHLLFRYPVSMNLTGQRET